MFNIENRNSLSFIICLLCIILFYDLFSPTFNPIVTKNASAQLTRAVEYADSISAVGKTPHHQRES